MDFLVPGHPLAQSALQRLLFGRLVLPRHVGRHAVRGHWLHRLLLGTKGFLNGFKLCIGLIQNIRYIFFFAFLQAASPACTELETVMLDWLGKMLNLPDCFLAGTSGHGGGVIQVISLSLLVISFRRRAFCTFPPAVRQQKALAAQRKQTQLTPTCCCGSLGGPDVSRRRDLRINHASARFCCYIPVHAPFIDWSSVVSWHTAPENCWEIAF